MSPGLSLPAAVAAVGIDSGIAWHYGDPMREQRILETAAGVIDRSNRPVLAISGPDRLPWLHSICSQHVSNLSDGQSTEALVLSPHGHVEHHWQLTERDGMVWVDVEPGTADDVLLAAGYSPPVTGATAGPGGGFARRTPWGDVALVVSRGRLADEIAG